MNARIKEARKARNYSQKALADKIGISDAALSKIESGINNPAKTTLILIANELHVSLKWLETGEGAMELETQTQMLDRVARRYSKSRTFRALLDVFMQLDEEGQDSVETYIEKLTDALARSEDPAGVEITQEDLAKNAEKTQKIIAPHTGEATG